MTFVLLKTLTPDVYNVQVKTKVLSLIISLNTKHEKSKVKECTAGSNIVVHEYLIGDHTASAIINTSQTLDISQSYEIYEGHTSTVDGYLRIHSENIKPMNEDITEINAETNRSLIQFSRKL
ncbi:hypothetical protein BY458DRAFT_564913 [Sporodiniella umbellata]|nr:hypothetical protein BY458DRAFT_564913 [Sporodiniella umbellata]